MRGRTERQGEMLLGVSVEEFIPANHPIRRIRQLVDEVLAELSLQFSAMYSSIGRPSVPPEHLIKGSLLMALYSIRSERQFCERLQYDLLFKWFLGLTMLEPAFDATSFTKNRQRLLGQEIALSVLAEVVRQARRRKLISGDHFSVDGTLLQAWASLKSVRLRDNDEEPPAGGAGRNPDVDFKGQQRANATHVSTTDPQARRARKGNGQETKLCYAGHLLTENRNGLILGVLVTEATGTAEREAALQLLDQRLTPHKRMTLGADKGYDTKAFVEALREREVTPHIARNVSGRRSSAIDGRTTGYARSLRARKRIEECFGWMKTVAGGRKLRYMGLAKNQHWATFTVVAYNLIRIAKLEPHAA
ncbi:MAG: IS5 family transposase [Chloroflexota bacterium]|nr:MAG: IS5 family transposase [Chloroflexota bacterium]